MEIYPSNGSVVGGRPVTVLLAEDEPLIRLDIAYELRGAGWSVVEVGTADAAIPLLDTIKFDVVVTDVNMPGQADGLDLVRLVNEGLPDVRVVVISGTCEPPMASIDKCL